MMEIQDYPSRMGDAAAKKFEAFSYLPPMNAAQVRAQLQRVADNDWDIVIEHVEPDRADCDYWYMWKLPLFGERNVDAVLAQADACRSANPAHHVRISGIDRNAQTIGFSLVAHRAG